MEIILKILIMVVMMCASESSIYDWHINTIESNSDFGDDLKMQTALNKERQQDLFRISGKTSGTEQHRNQYSNERNKNMEKNNKDIVDVKDFFEDKYDIKHKATADFQRLFNQNNNFTRMLESKEDKTNYGNGSNSDSKFNEHHRTSHKNNKHSNNRDESEFNMGPCAFNKQNPHIAGNDKHTPNDLKLKESEEFQYIDIENFVGTNLFDTTDKTCFSCEDVVMLNTRKNFESLIPKNLPQCLFNDQMVALLFNYFYLCHHMIMESATVSSKHMVQKAFYDTLGGYLNFYMVPVAKYSYYAGQISLTAAQQILTLQQESRRFLNTNGNGWKAPLQNVLIELKSVQIEPLHIPELDEDTRNEPSFCMQLDMNTDENHPDNDKIIVEIPKLERENSRGFLGNLWLPFKRKKTFDLKDDSSTYIVVKFYEAVTKCYQFENIEQEFYNQKFQTWLLENINIHLSDEEFYPGLGAVLRIYQYLEGRRKNVIDIGNDLRPMQNIDGIYNKYSNHKIKKEKQLHERRGAEQQAAEERYNIRKASDNDLKESNESNDDLSEDIANRPAKIFSERDNKLENAVDSVSKNSKALLVRFFALTPLQMALITITLLAVLFVIIICFCMVFRKKRKPQTPEKFKKNSSSSSSNLLNSPVRFFNIRKKTNTNDYSANEAASLKNYKRKSVKIEKKPLINSDSSISRSPSRTKKKVSMGFKNKEKSKDTVKSNV